MQEPRLRAGIRVDLERVVVDPRNVQAAGHAHDGRRSVRAARFTSSFVLRRIPQVRDAPAFRFHRQHRDVALRRHHHAEMPVLGDNRHPISGQVLDCPRAPGLLLSASTLATTTTLRQRDAGKTEKKYEDERKSSYPFERFHRPNGSNNSNDSNDWRKPVHSTTPCHSQPSTGRLIEKIRIRCASGSRPGSPAAMMRSPNLSVVRVTGNFAAESWVLEPHSRFQISGLPSFITSMRTNECGLRQTNSFTTPSISTRFPDSYAAVNE